MNKDTTRLLQQLRSEIDALRQRLATMETSLDELQSQLESEAAVPEAVEPEAVDLSAVAIDAFTAVGETAEVSPLQKDSASQSDAPAPPTPAGVIEDNLSEAGPSPYPRPGVDKPSAEEIPPQIVSPTAEPKPKPSVMESTDRYAWRKDMPGLAVRDIRSAIALNDRVLFINLLFQQDAVRFQNVLNALNSFETFPEAEDFLRSNFPQWNYDSEVVYRFMMAVRRKLR